MKVRRKVVARKNQWLVALPSELKRHLALVPGVDVWWHIGKKGQATLTLTGRVRPGQHPEEEDCSACANYRKELERLRHEVRDGETATAGEMWRAGYARALGDMGNVKADVELCLVLLKRLLAEQHRAEPILTKPRGRRARRIVTTPGPDEYPSPNPSLAPAVVEEGAGTSGT